jgi:putative endonuclease
MRISLRHGCIFSNVADAFYREKQVQGWTRRKREALINGTPELLPVLAKKILIKRKSMR